MQVELGDVDRDGAIGLADFALLKSQMGQQGKGLAADLDGDGDVDLDDFAILRPNFGLQTTQAVKHQQPGPVVWLDFVRAAAIDIAMASAGDSE
jgi:hypothetical protein